MQEGGRIFENFDPAEQYLAIVPAARPLSYFKIAARRNEHDDTKSLAFSSAAIMRASGMKYGLVIQIYFLAEVIASR